MAFDYPGKILRSSILGMAAALLLVSGTHTSDAGSYWHRNGSGIAAAGIIGFAAGAVIGSALSGPRYYGGYGYYAPRAYYAPRVYFAPRAYPVAPRYHAPVYPDRSYGYVNRSSGTVIAPHAPVPVYNRAPVRYRPAQWSPEWIAYCSRKYKSFNPRTGTYTAYSGRVRRCR